MKNYYSIRAIKAEDNLMAVESCEQSIFDESNSLCDKIIQEDKMSTVFPPKFVIGVDWPLLTQQKRELLSLQTKSLNTITVEELEAIDGIIDLLDALQDYAVDEVGLDENIVFGFNEE
jgi:hypothetical protein